MATKFYQCRHCAITIKKDSTPSTSGCSAPKQSFHSWTKLGEIGENNYSCKKCGKVVQTKSTPTTSNCPDPNSNFHSWTKI
jgi:rubrerythrin